MTARAMFTDFQIKQRFTALYYSLPSFPTYKIHPFQETRFRTVSRGERNENCEETSRDEIPLGTFYRRLLAERKRFLFIYRREVPLFCSAMETEGSLEGQSSRFLTIVI